MIRKSTEYFFAILIISSLIQLAAILSFTSAVKPKTIGGSIFFEV